MSLLSSIKFLLFKEGIHELVSQVRPVPPLHPGRSPGLPAIPLEENNRSFERQGAPFYRTPSLWMKYLCPKTVNSTASLYEVIFLKT
jgi:hypothetical protein